MLTDLPIGVFDSGMGGLTVLKQLIHDFPAESFLYLGDTARLPYGTKSPETVERYALQITQLLIKRGIKLLVVACNTATTAALPMLKKTFPELPIVGVVEPGAKAVVAATRHKHVAVLATETTIASGIYQSTIKQLDPFIHVETQACGLFVALAEEGVVEGDIPNAVADFYLKPLLSRVPECDAIILGCTHFPVLSGAISSVLPKSIALINSAQVTSEAVGALLHDLNLNHSSATRSIHFLVTDQIQRFARSGRLFFGATIPENQIELVNL